MNAPRRLRPVRMPPRHVPPQRAPVGSGLLFCAVCQVSIAGAEVESGAARRTPKGRLFCAVCADASPEERARRRDELESEFADDAPVPVIQPAPIAVPRAVAAPAPQTVPPPIPTSAGDDPILELRVGELERATFRLQARVRSLEERLDALLRRGEQKS
jgi:hypothetical protein